MGAWSGRLISLGAAGSAELRGAGARAGLRRRQAGAPLLALLAARAAGRVGREAAGPGRVALALSAELVHSATLLHDDVVDDGLTRRGLPAPRVAYGNSVSVLSGDWMLAQALDLALRSRVPGAVPALVRTLRELVAGEGRQLALRGDANFTPGDALWIAQMKTGSLFGYCAEAGGLSARAPAPLTEALRAFGLACGTAFQISDDLLDFESDAATLGKAVLADVAEGKASVPLALALEETPALRTELRALLHEQLAPEAPGAPAAAPDEAPANELRQARLRAFAARIARTPALTRARALAADERDRALQALALLPESPTRALLGLVATLLLERHS